MFSKSQIKLIKSLAQKKYRTKHKLFFAEGKKTITELLDSHLELHSLYTTEDVFSAEEEKTFILSEKDLKKISNLSTPQTALAVFHFPEKVALSSQGLIIALDGVRDPGNLGTLIRLCDWFGVDQMICSNDTVDCYNPKVIQATMGSIARVSVLYTPLKEFLEETPKLIYGAFMNGSNVYSEKLVPEAVLVLGNEANGISEEIESVIKNRISIPQFGETQRTESLNVATAGAILISEFRRN